MVVAVNDAFLGRLLTLIEKRIIPLDVTGFVGSGSSPMSLSSSRLIDFSISNNLPIMKLLVILLSTLNAFWMSFSMCPCRCNSMWLAWVMDAMAFTWSAKQRGSMRMGLPPGSPPYIANVSMGRAAQFRVKNALRVSDIHELNDNSPLTCSNARLMRHTKMLLHTEEHEYRRASSIGGCCSGCGSTRVAKG